MKPLSYANDHTVADWLTWFTGEADSLMPSPFAVPRFGRAATDGKIAVVVNDGGPVVENSENTRRQIRIPGHLASMMKDQNSPEKMANVGGEFFRSMIGPCDHIEVQKCTVCKSKGRIPHYCDCDLCEAETEKCDQCDGDGQETVYPKDRYIAIFGKPFNPNLVAYVLEHAPKPEPDEYSVRLVSVEKEQTKKSGVNYHLHIVTSTWTAIVVPMTDNALKEHECPEILDKVEAVQG